MTTSATITTYAVAVGVADVRRGSDPNSDLVTLALLNVLATTSGEWIHVILSDNEGWKRAVQLADSVVTKVGEHCTTHLDRVAVVIVPHTPIYSDATDQERRDTAYLSTAFPIVDTTYQQRIPIALPGGEQVWLDREAMGIRSDSEHYPRSNVHQVTHYAMPFPNVPYLWGGTTWEGIDCSGFVQLCHRMVGYIIPRDAHQQYDVLTHSATNEEMCEGDLIFFGSESITYVALALNNADVSSFDPISPRYSDRLANLVWGIKRVIP